MNAVEMRQKRAKIITDLRGMVDQAGAAKRDFTAEENQTYERMMADAEKLMRDIERVEGLEALERGGRSVFDPIRMDPQATPGGFGHMAGSAEPRLMDQNGREVRLIRRGESITRGMELPDGFSPGELDLGRLVRAAVTGDWKHAAAERDAMRVMGGANDVLGGYAVPSILSGQIIDMARNQTRVIEAGAYTVPMESADLKLARVDQDPTAYWKGENEPGTPSDMGFGQIRLYAKTLLAVCKCSVELLEDSANLSLVVTNAISAGLALELDRVALLGSGGIEPAGLDGTAGIGEVDLGTDGEQVTYQEFGEAYFKILDANGPAEGISVIAAPRTLATIDYWRDGLGNPLGAPESWKAMRKLSTNQVPIDQAHGNASNASTAYVGDFSQLWIGMRTQMALEVSREASDIYGSAFTDLQIWIRAYLRADIAVVRPGWFTKITGILPFAEQEE